MHTELAALETLCGEIERALMTRTWSRLEAALADSRRTMHALENAMDAARSERDTEFDNAIDARLRYVFAIRQNQMARLQQYHDALGERLKLLARWKHALRSLGSGRSPKRLASLDRLS